MSDREWVEEERRQREINAARAEAVLAFARDFDYDARRSEGILRAVDEARMFIQAQGWSETPGQVAIDTLRQELQQP